MSAIPPYRTKLLALHRDLVSIDSVTGRENEVGEFLVAHLEKNGYQTSRQVLPNRSDTPADRPRFNVLAWPKRKAASLEDVSAPRLLVTAHIDTVPPHIPYSIDSGEVTVDTKIHGRGSSDTKGAVAAQIVALDELLAEGRVRGEDVMLLYVVGEEEGGDGMRHFSRVLNARCNGGGGGAASDPAALLQRLPLATGFDAAIFGEPTEGKLARGHKGLIICTVKARGLAGHSGYPWLGKSANELLVRALQGLLDGDLGSSERFGRTTVNVGVMRGGVAGNVIPEAAEASLVLRVATGPQADGHEQVKQRMLEILRDVDAEAFTVEWGASFGAVPCDYDVEGNVNLLVRKS
ncbi:Peptidase M20 domain-containing protein [Beauveria bassiana]|uniref:Peptidase M20 domain-containing protein n=1 Tax=Beauveria bassiana TaxID=176275 RepID=A0A2N6NBR0_BEABA|nr:Peptidase M20 domain-containing protein [Beauveria bassiana]